MQRPCWTISLALIWLLVFPGVILTHMALNSLIPALKELPDNILVGFDETFKFKYLKSGIQNLQDKSSDALAKCNESPNAGCSYQIPNTPGPDVSVKTERDAILDVFDSTLNIIEKVASDKYFGVDSFKTLADNLKKIKTEIEDNAEDEMPCAAIEPTFCEIYNAADTISGSFTMVDDAIDSFKSNQVVDSWEEYADYLIGLHALPWLLVIGKLFFLIFWYKAGKCCPWGLCLLPFILLWLTSFVIYAVILGAGVVIMYGADRVPMPMLNGEPSLNLVIEHFKEAFAPFWDVVFEPMVVGLTSLFNASCFFVPVMVVIALYALFMCCCCPYTSKSGDDDEPEPSSYSGPMDAVAGRAFIQAVRAEYVEDQGAKVGEFFDSLGGAEGAFGPFEERIRLAPDKAAAIDQIVSEWGL